MAALGMLMAHEEVLCKLGEVVKQLHQDSIGNEASFDCMPDNLDHLYGTAEVVMNRQSEPLLGSSMCRRAADCKVRLPGSTHVHM